MVTISDVAREAGVSVATVSRALNNAPTVAPELASRAREAASRLGYRPNGIARSLRRQATDVLALIISDVANPFWTAVTRGVEDVAQRSGYSVLLCNADENSVKEATYLRVAEQQRVAAVISSPHAASCVRDLGELPMSDEAVLAQALIWQRVAEKAIIGVYDEGCMGMYNMVVDDELLNPLGIDKERLSWRALWAEMLVVLDEDAYAPDAVTADRALVAKAAFFTELGVAVHLCGDVGDVASARLGGGR